MTISHNSHYAGFSLRFVREMIGHQAIYASAATAWRAVDSRRRYYGAPSRGCIAYYETANGNGNVAICVARDQVLTVGPDGNPRVYTYDDPQLGSYLGCSLFLGQFRARMNVEKMMRRLHGESENREVVRFGPVSIVWNR